jgi:hypothetical protein
LVADMAKGPGRGSRTISINCSRLGPELWRDGANLRVIRERRSRMDSQLPEVCIAYVQA